MYVVMSLLSLLNILSFQCLDIRCKSTGPLHYKVCTVSVSVLHSKKCQVVFVSVILFSLSKLSLGFP